MIQAKALIAFTGYGYSKSAGEEFAIENDMQFFDLAKAGLVTTANGQPVKVAETFNQAQQNEVENS